MKTRIQHYTYLLKVVLTIILLGGALFVVYGQSSKYIIYDSDSEPLGELKVEKYNEGNSVHIDVSSKIKVKKLITITVSYTLNSIFRKNELQHNSIVTYRNKAANSVMETKKVGSHYEFMKDGEKQSYDKKIDFSESMMYFNEPLGRTSVYSEFDGVEKTINRFKENHYKIRNPLNGNISEYIYKNGLLDRATVYHALITLHLIREG